MSEKSIAHELAQELTMIVKGWEDMAKLVRLLTPWEIERKKFAEEILEKYQVDPK